MISIPGFNINNLGNSPTSGASAQSIFQPSTPQPSQNNASSNGPGGAYPIAGGVPSGGGAVNHTAVPAPVGGAQPSQPAPDPYAAIRQGISSAWDSYLGSLGGIQGDLNNQQTAQQGIANTQLDQGQNTLNSQKAQSLRDIANTTRSAFQAGNNYLGSMGAGDSSAANQYSFAINQQAGKQTGDLNNFVNTQLNQLQSQHDTQINSIANWFSQQQEALKQQMAQGSLQKGQDLNNLSQNILNQAMQATNQIKAQTQNQYNALLSWAANNSQNVGQLQQNIAAIPQPMGAVSLFGGSNSTPSFVPGNQSTTSTGLKTDIFGNPIQ